MARVGEDQSFTFNPLCKRLADSGQRNGALPSVSEPLAMGSIGHPQGLPAPLPLQTRPISSPQVPPASQITGEQQQEISQICQYFNEVIEDLNHQIHALRAQRDTQDQKIDKLHVKLSQQKSGSEDSPGFMKKLTWFVKNCFAKPAAALICAGLALGALAIMFNPIVGAPCLLAAMVTHMAFPLLVGGVAAGAFGIACLADEKERRADEAKRQAGPDYNAGQPDELDDTEDANGTNGTDCTNDANKANEAHEARREKARLKDTLQLPANATSESRHNASEPPSVDRIAVDKMGDPMQPAIGYPFQPQANSLAPAG